MSENDSALEKEARAFTWGEGMGKEFPLSVVLEFLIMNMYYIVIKKILEKDICVLDILATFLSPAQMLRTMVDTARA